MGHTIKIQSHQMKYNLINIKGKWLVLLGMNGGHFTCSNLFDINNDFCLQGVIWEHQPFFEQNEIWYGNILKFIVHKSRIIIQFVKGDV